MLVIREIHKGGPEWSALLDEIGPLKLPKRLFAMGQPVDPEKPCIAIVGTRRPTIAGIEVADRLARGLAQGGFTIVSGLAVGIDAVAHRAAIEAGGTTIAVLGCGLDVLYPKANVQLRKRIIEHGTLLSEYPEGMQPMAHQFPERNRIVAGLSVGVVVVEGGYRSGALITARRALEANRNVYAVPGSLRNPMAHGPNMLIARGEAQLVTTFKDICDDLAPAMLWAGGPTGMPDLEDGEAEVIVALDDTPAAPDALLRATGMPPGRMALLLARLEVRGWAVRSAAGYSLSTGGASVRHALLSGNR